MATNTLPSGKELTKERSGSLTPTDIATAILAPLASLKLTVFLLFTAIAVVFIATLQQASMDMWSVKYMHYDNWFVTIPFQALLIERWFPDYQNVPGSFVIPSGKLIIYALIVNLVAAHLMRFKVKAKGMKLWLGVVTAVIAGVVTWAMSFNTFGADGFQKAPPVTYSQMWLIMQVILLGMTLSCIAGIFLTGDDKRIEKAILGTFAFLAAAVLLISIILGKDAFVGDSGMRILWQLAQSTIAACVAWGACILLFQRKAGIVLLHFGVVGLMANELYVTYTNVETQIQFVEGETTSVAIDARETEFVVLDQSDPDFDNMVAIPESIFRSGEVVSDDRLPFSVKCLEFYDNSAASRTSEPNPAINGFGKNWLITELPISASNRKFDIASARVELISKSGQSLGIWMVTQDLRAFIETVTVDDKDYRIALRYKTEYKPYELTLNDVKAEFYTGTETPRWYSSKVELNDLNSESKSEHEIWMNNPLRYNGETFYQSGYVVDQGKEISTIQIVKNRGWMIPYICCMFTVVGLAGQFGSSLIAFLKKSKARTEDKTPEAELVTSQRRFNWRSPGILIPSCVAAVFGVYALYGISKSAKPVVHESGMRLDRLGEIPITHKGRIQPLESFARNTARQFSKREFVYDQNLDKQPAIRWLADTMFKAKGYDGYRLFRIEDLEILATLDLPVDAVPGEPKGVRFRYTLEQLEDSPQKMFALLPPPETPDSQYSQYQTRIKILLGHMQQAVGLSAVLPKETAGFEERLNRQRGRLFAATMENGKPFPVNPERWPRFIPKGDEWMSLSVAENRRWLADKATALESDTIISLYPKLLKTDSSVASFQSDTAIAFLQNARDILFSKDQILKAQQEGAKTQEEIADVIMASPKAIEIQAQSIELVQGLLARLNGDSNDIDTSGSSLDVKLAGLFQQMGDAYRAGDDEKFNTLTDQYLATARETDELQGYLGTMKVEKVYNGWSPFYISMVLYLMAFVVVAFSWFTSFDPRYSKILGRTAIAIVIIALVVQAIGLVMRVYISGRPPITNLYSSALFVSAIFVLIMLVVEAITRLGVGTAMATVGAYAALLWAWTMSIADGDTFSVLVAVLDTQFWLSTHVVCITIGYAVTFAAGFIALGYILASMFTTVIDKQKRKLFSNIIYGVTCFALFFSFFGTVLGGLWGDDSWGRFWGWDPKENGALMIVLWSALLLHARWGGLVKERGIAILAILGNIIVLWSWKGVNSMNVGLHAYAGSEDTTVFWILMVGLAHLVIAAVALVPTRLWLSHARN